MRFVPVRGTVTVSERPVRTKSAASATRKGKALAARDDLDATVAAILASVSLKIANDHTPKQMVGRYRKVLDHIRDTGGALASDKESEALETSDEVLGYLKTKQP